MSKLSHNGYETRIAGGYPRDLIYQRKHKDVDFFIEIRKECDQSYFVEELLPEALNSVGIENDLHQSYMEYSAFSPTFSVWNSNELQFILINYHINDIFPYFDYSINQVGFKPDGSLYYSENFLHTYSTKEIIKVRPVSGHRDDYIKSKFPGFVIKGGKSRIQKIKAPQYDNLNIHFDDYVNNILPNNLTTESVLGALTEVSVYADPAETSLSTGIEVNTWPGPNT